ncbi:MAG: hypothetical protein LW686_03215 [Ilumatobacteraceae bacterium]|nr:hypothetical protein [Ilumatobacteraceae bacterium]
MCRQVTCKKCQRPSWAGCGAHVEQVLGHVAKADRCNCSTKTPATTATTGGRRWFRSNKG